MKKVLVETSARHIHLNEEQFKVLFGQDAELHVKKMLSQPGQFASEERVTIVGPKKALANVSILGPFRKEAQVELSATDARSIGLPIMVRESGDLKGTPGCTIQGPAGELVIEQGVIVAKRHIHATKADALELGLENGQIVKVKVDTEGRSLIFDDVVVRVSDSYAFAMHIDTDESNACMPGAEQMGEIIK